MMTGIKLPFVPGSMSVFYSLYVRAAIGGNVMAKGEPLSRRDACRQKSAVANYNCLKEIIVIATRNGWDLESLGLIPKDLPAEESEVLTRKQVLERNRLVKGILQRFSGVLTPPAPLDLEQFIRSKGESDWLPWEKEVVDKIERWRSDVSKVKPEILKELYSVMPTGS